MFWKNTINRELIKLHDLIEFHRDVETAADPVSSLLMAALPANYTITIIDDVDALKEFVALIPRALLDICQITEEQANERVSEFVRASFRTTASSIIYRGLSSPVDVVARDRVNALPFSEGRTSQFIHKIGEELTHIPIRNRLFWLPVTFVGLMTALAVGAIIFDKNLTVIFK